MDILKESWEAYHPWILGFAVTAVMSYGRFNTPPTSRSSTTWGRYHLMATLYSLAFIATWIIFASTPEIVASLSNNAYQIGQFKSLDTPIYAALLLIVLAGGVVPFSTFDDKVRHFLQDLARIPWEVQRLTAALCARTWLPSEDFQDEIRRALRSRAFDDADMSFSCEHTPQALWTRNTALMRYISEWQTRRGKFAAYYFANIKVVAQHEEEYEQLERQAKRVFPKVKTAATGGSGPAIDDEVKEELAHSFVTAAERLEKALCETVSRGVLTCGLTDGARRAEFEKIGFMVNVTPSRLFDDVLALYLALAAVFIVVMSLARRPRPWLTAVIIATIYMGAVVTAILLKRWTWARSRNGSIPVSGCVVAAVVAFGFAFLTSLGLAVILTFNVREAWELVTTRWWPWGFMSAVVAGLLAYLIDLEETPNRRWIDVGMMACVCGATAVAVVGLLTEACGGARCDNPPLLRVVLNSIVVGAIIGWCVPSWYRRPQIMVTEYLGFKVIISLRTKDSGVVASVDLEPPRRSTVTKGRVRLGDVETVSPDDAIADAVREARTWVDSDRTASVPPLQSSVPVALSLSAPMVEVGRTPK